MAVVPDYAILAVFVLSSLAVATTMLYAGNAATALVWTAALVPWAAILMLRAPENMWLPGLTAGFAGGLATGLLLFALKSTYVANHPADAAKATFLGLVGFSAVAGLAWGVLAAAIAWGVKRAS